MSAAKSESGCTQFFEKNKIDAHDDYIVLFKEHFLPFHTFKQRSVKGILLL